MMTFNDRELTAICCAPQLVCLSYDNKHVEDSNLAVSHMETEARDLLSRANHCLEVTGNPGDFETFDSERPAILSALKVYKDFLNDWINQLGGKRPRHDMRKWKHEVIKVMEKLR